MLGKFGTIILSFLTPFPILPSFSRAFKILLPADLFHIYSYSFHNPKLCWRTLYRPVPTSTRSTRFWSTQWTKSWSKGQGERFSLLPPEKNVLRGGARLEERHTAIWSFLTFCFQMSKDFATHIQPLSRSKESSVLNKLCSVVSLAALPLPSL